MLQLLIPVYRQEIWSPTSIAASAEFRVLMHSLGWVVIDLLANNSVEVQSPTQALKECIGS